MIPDAARIGRVRVPAVCAAVALCLAGTAAGQLSIVEQLSITGTVESVAGGRVTVRDEAGDRQIGRAHV